MRRGPPAVGTHPVVYRAAVPVQELRAGARAVVALLGLQRRVVPAVRAGEVPPAGEGKRMRDRIFRPLMRTAVGRMEVISHLIGERIVCNVLAAVVVRLSLNDPFERSQGRHRS
eukprot:evm.model.scf_761.2 EVM.evm.TU.scf_761.2   scf_761:27636-27977(-)